VCVCVRVCSRRLRQEWPRQGSSCNLRPQPMFIVQQCRGRSLASLRTTPLSRCCSRIPSSPPLPAIDIDTMPPPYHRTQLATPPVLVQCSSTRRSIHISDIPTRPAHGPMVCRTPAPLAPPPLLEASTLCTPNAPLRWPKWYDFGRTRPSQWLLPFISIWSVLAPRDQGGRMVAQVQRKTCPVVARIRIRIRIAFAPPRDCRSPQFNAAVQRKRRVDGWTRLEGKTASRWCRCASVETLCSGR
jgi:hypothetical protein